MRRIYLYFICAAALSAVVSGCDADSGGNDGDENGNPTGGVNIPVDDNRTVSTLSAEEAHDACEAIVETGEAWAQDNEEAICQMIGSIAAVVTYQTASMFETDTDSGVLLGDAELQEVCAEAVQECMVSEGEGFDTDDACAEAGEDLPENCDATVGEIEACYDARVTELNDQMDSVSLLLPQCDELTADGMDVMMAGLGGMIALGSNQQLPPECEVVEEKCPSMMEDLNILSDMDMMDTDMGLAF